MVLVYKTDLDLAQEEESPLYDQARSYSLKRLNLEARALLYRQKYIPKIREMGVFDGASNSLEVGAGFGSKFARTIEAFPGISFRGIEQSSEMIQRASQYHPEIASLIELGDARDLENVNSGSQDVLMYYQMLHHLGWEDTAESLEAAKKTLAPGGKILIIDTFTDETRPVRQLVFDTTLPIYALLSTKKGMGGYQFKPEQEFVGFVEDHGFRLIDQHAPLGKLAVSEIMVFEKI